MMLPFIKSGGGGRRNILQHQEMNIIEYVTGSWEVTFILVTATYQHSFHITLRLVIVLLKTPYSYLHFYITVLVHVNRGWCYNQLKFFFPLPPPQEHLELSKNACVSF